MRCSTSRFLTVEKVKDCLSYRNSYGIVVRSIKLQCELMIDDAEVIEKSKLQGVPWKGVDRMFGHFICNAIISLCKRVVFQHKILWSTIHQKMVTETNEEVDVYLYRLYISLRMQVYVYRIPSS